MLWLTEGPRKPPIGVYAVPTFFGIEKHMLIKRPNGERCVVVSAFLEVLVELGRAVLAHLPVLWVIIG